jgi:hypothetical protein
MRLFKGSFSRIFFCAMLALASMSGANMRPDEIEELMRNVSRPVIAHSLKDESDATE